MFYSDRDFNGYATIVNLGGTEPLRMHPVVRDMWTTALESGDYVQGRHRLVNRASIGGSVVRRFCCLGVLCDLAERAGLVTYDDYHSDFRTIVNGEVVFRDASSLPEVVARWAGLWTDDPVVRRSAGSSALRLSYVNDKLGEDFDVIAQLIRTSL